jgi:hypothetical protein
VSRDENTTKPKTISYKSDSDFLIKFDLDRFILSMGGSLSLPRFSVSNRGIFAIFL